MASRGTPDFNTEAKKLEQRLPRFAGAALRWAIDASPFIRWPIAIIFIFGGFLGFLPILGFWMAPLGLLVLSYEFHVVRRLRRRFIVWWEKRRRNGAAGALRDGQRPGGGSA